MINYNFSWNEKKAKSNIKKHKVSFEQATQVFLDQFALTIFDEAHSDYEERWVTLGKVENSKTLVVVHTYVEKHTNAADIRIISARKATKKEQAFYKGD